MGKAKGTPGFARVNTKISASLGYPLSASIKTLPSKKNGHTKHQKKNPRKKEKKKERRLFCLFEQRFKIKNHVNFEHVDQQNVLQQNVLF